MSSRSAVPAATDAFVVAHLVGCSITWGMGFMLMKLIDGGLSVPVIAAMRALLAAAVLAAAVVAMGRSPLPEGREVKDWLVLGTVNGWAPNMLVAYALLHMDSGPAALIQASGPLMTALLAHAFLTGERLTAARIIGIAVGAAGVALLIGPKAFAGGSTTLAVAAMLLLTFGYAVGNIYARTIRSPEPIRMALGQQAVSAVVATTVALAIFGPSGFAQAPTHAGPLLALGLLATAVPIWLFMRLITAAGPTKAAMTGYLVPATAVVLGVAVLGEPIVPRQIAGGLIVLLGVAIVTGLIRLPARRPA
ncbi:MAG: DMT family transporter [Beijerinckiaceae bacterium]